MINPKSLDNLKPPVKGEVRNPNGRPKGIPNSKTRWARILEATQDVKNPVTGEIEKFTIMEQIDLRLIQQARNGNLKAINLILDRLEGQAARALDITSGGKELPRPILGGESIKDGS